MRQARSHARRAAREWSIDGLTTYLRLRASGTPVELAAEQAGLGLTEARLTEKAVEAGELALPHVRARAREDQSPGEEANMANDNSTAKTPASASTVAGEKLRLFIERVERLEEEIKDLNSDKSDVFQEAKSDGFDTKTMKRIMKLRKMEPHARQEAEALLETYMNALGMTPIEAAIALAAFNAWRNSRGPTRQPRRSATRI
jgi:uncharacterized protein (UPF0335 family)